MSQYIFPDFLSKAMSKVDLRTQFEASMLSMSMMSVGLILTVIYFIIYFKFALWYKIFLGINGLAGLVFMWSMIITTFNQYQSYLEAIKFQKENKENDKRKI